MSRSFFKQKLDELEQEGLRRELKQLTGSQSRAVVIDGKTVLNFCSNNYLGLADDLRLADAASEAIRQEGFGSGASRLVCGNMTSHSKLEKAIASFKGSESCLFFNSGYMANVGIISSLFNRDDIIFGDKLNHASIIDGITLSRAKHKRYAHCDMEALEEGLKEADDYKKRGIITDSVFSMDGDLAPLDKIVDLARKYDAMVMIDEAHAFGVFGENGKGLAEHFGLEKEIDIQMGTLSKAVGVFGAYCCGSKELIDYLINHARSFIYTTGLPPVVAEAALKSIEIIMDEPELRKKLLHHANYVRAQLNLMGFKVISSPSPIIPIIVRDPQLAIEFSNRLFEKGIFVQGIRPPTVPKDTARLRLTVMATHTDEDIEALLDALRLVGKELRII